MFGIIYLLNALVLVYGITQHNYILIPISIVIYIITAAWQSDRDSLRLLQHKVGSAKDKSQLINIAKQKATEFKDLSWFQKIIYITAFKSGAEFILRKLK